MFGLFSRSRLDDYVYIPLNPSTYVQVFSEGQRDDGQSQTDTQHNCAALRQFSLSG